MTDPKTILFYALITFAVTALGVLGKIAVGLGNALLKKLNQEALTVKVGVAAEQLGVVVDMIKQTVLPELEIAAEDGRIDDKERAHLRDLALGEAKRRLGPDFWRDLFKQLGVPEQDRDAWILGQVEALVLRAKAGSKSAASPVGE